jgi:hypothetical protein
MSPIGLMAAIYDYLCDRYIYQQLLSLVLANDFAIILGDWLHYGFSGCLLSVGASGVVAGIFSGICWALGRLGKALVEGATTAGGVVIAAGDVNQPPLNTTVSPKNAAVKNQVTRFKAVSALFVLEKSCA